MRLSEIADRLAALEGRDEDEIHIRLRNPLFKGLLRGESGRSRNSPADYPPLELIRAGILLAMSDCGLTTAEMSMVIEFFGYNGLEEMVLAALEGETFYLSLLVKKQDKDESRTVLVRPIMGSVFDVNSSNETSGAILIPLSHKIRQLNKASKG